MAVRVSLREKPISKGRKSLYLDFYPSIINPKTGKQTRREFLRLYIYNKPKRDLERKHNKETLIIGEGIRQRRENELNKPEIYSNYEREQLRIEKLGEVCFVDYFLKLAKERRHSTHDNWMAASNYLIAYTNEHLPFNKLNEKFLEDFKEYLLTVKSKRSDKTTLSQNSASSYFNKVKAALKQAYRDGYLQIDLNSRVKSIKAKEIRRSYLTVEELNNLVKTPCNNPLLKRAALFSALTGLRFSDIQKITWKEIEFIESDGYVINYVQKKTKGVESLPISGQAYELTHGKKSPRLMEQDAKVFDGLKYSAYHNKHLYQWIGAAGITKDITFHCFRHTYATLQLMGGTDLYTVSKLLGHKDLKTTQIYAKIVDETKREAANRISINLSDDE
jgi:integrase